MHHFVSSFYCHTLLRKTKTSFRADLPEVLFLCIDNVGGELNAYTTKEKTCVYASFTSEHIDRATDLLSDILFNSTYPEKEIEKEKDEAVRQWQVLS